MTTTPPAGLGEHIQVLVVEDNYVFIELVRLLCDTAKDVNFDVTIASTAQEGLALFDIDVHDVILLDMYMPNGKGLGLVKSFLDAAGPDIPVIVMTAFDDPVGAADIIKAGAAEVIAKDRFDSTRLVALLKGVTERRRSLYRIRKAAQTVHSAL